MSTRLSRSIAATFTLSLALASLATALAVPPGNTSFFNVWDRTDGPVAELLTSRTWMWGPEANTGLRWEPYLESGQPGRATQMFDKSRMEITHPDALDDGLWYVTNGLLVVELITGRMQIGDDVHLQLDPANVNVAGDSDDPLGPTYSTFLDLLEMTPSTPGAPVITRLSRDGGTQADPALAARGIVIAVVDDVTDHAIAAPFWDFMLSSGLVRTQAGLVTEPLFINPFYATGRPITEPYWANVKIANAYRDVLMQCFERRCLTYTPDNPPGWQVEAGNVGQHYETWRYDSGFEYAIEWIDAAAGGSVDLNGVTVTIPPGALARDTLVTIVPSRNSPEPPAGYVPVSISHDIGLSGATLLAPVELTLPYDAGTIPSSAGPDDLVAGRAGAALTWELLAAEASDGSIALQTSSLSAWQVFSPIEEGPYIDLNGSQLPGTSVEASFTSGSGANRIAPHLIVSDTTSSSASFAIVKIENLLDGNAEQLTASVNSSGLMTHYASGVLTITGDAPLATYQEVLRTVAYNNVAASPNTSPRTVSFTFNNGSVASNTAIATITIKHDQGNAPPVAANASVTTTPSVATKIVLSATDADSPNLTFEIVTGPPNGSLDTLSPDAECTPAGMGVSCTATVTYTSNLGFTGMDAFTYRASDGEASSPQATVSLTLEYPDAQQWDIDAASGGVIDLPGRLILTIPAGALACDGVITISTIAPAMGNVHPPASNQHEITLDPADPYDPNCPFGSIMTPGATAELGLYYDPGSIPDGRATTDLYIGRLVGVTWEHLGNSWLDVDDPIIYVNTSTFSRWNVFIE